MERCASARRTKQRVVFIIHVCGQLPMATSMNNSEVTAQIIWTRQDVRQLLEDNGFNSTEESVDIFLKRLDLRRIEEACIQDGWERLSWVLLGKTLS